MWLNCLIFVLCSLAHKIFKLPVFYEVGTFGRPSFRKHLKYLILEEFTGSIGEKTAQQLVKTTWT